MDDRKKAHHKWVFDLYTAFQEDRIHCPGCLSQERLGYEWSIRLLEKKSDRTPREEEELKFDRLKIGFLDFICKKVCEKAAEKKAALIQMRLALDRAKRVLIDAAVPAVAVSSDVADPDDEDHYC